MLPWRRRSGPPIRCRGCNEQGHIERFCPKAKRTGYLSKRDEKCPFTNFIIPDQIDGHRVEMVLDSECEMTLVHIDLVDPKKINHREHTHLRCIHDHNSDYPTAEVVIEINGEPFKAVVRVSRDLPRHALLGKDFPAFYDLLENVKPAPKHSLVVTRAQVNRELEQERRERKEEKSYRLQPIKLEVGKKETPEITQEFGNMDVDSLIEVPTKAKVNKSQSDKRKERKLYSSMNTELKTEQIDEMDTETIRTLQKMD